MGLGIFLGLLISYSGFMTLWCIFVGVSSCKKEETQKKELAKLNFKIMVMEMEKNELQKTKENL